MRLPGGSRANGAAFFVFFSALLRFAACRKAVVSCVRWKYIEAPARSRPVARSAACPPVSFVCVLRVVLALSCEARREENPVSAGASRAASAAPVHRSVNERCAVRSHARGRSVYPVLPAVALLRQAAGLLIFTTHRIIFFDCGFRRQRRRGKYDRRICRRRFYLRRRRRAA